MNIELSRIISKLESYKEKDEKQLTTEESINNISRVSTFESLISQLEVSLKPALCFNLNDLSLFNNLEIGREIFVEKKDLKLKIQSLGKYGK